MNKKVLSFEEERSYREAANVFIRSKYPLALTGAGISVESGIPDFRSPGGLWTIFRPEEYATIDVFWENPQKAWELYRAIAESMEGKKPNDAHLALVRLEEKGMLNGVITQNIDGLHEAAGNRNVMLIHGNSKYLECLKCGNKIRAESQHFKGDIPECPNCSMYLKPDYVLFGEPVREMEVILENLRKCDALLVIGTSCQVYPAASFPEMVRAQGGVTFEFNLTCGSGKSGMLSLLFGASSPFDYFFEGKASVTVSKFVEMVFSIIGKS